jgi:hypothetical protein
MKKILLSLIVFTISSACSKDKEKPSIDISQPANDVTINKDSEITCSFACSDNKELHEVNYEVKALTSGSILASGKEDVDNKTYTKTFTFRSPNAASKIELKVEADDHSGNKVEKSIFVTIQ